MCGTKKRNKGRCFKMCKKRKRHKSIQANNLLNGNIDSNYSNCGSGDGKNNHNIKEKESSEKIYCKKCKGLCSPTIIFSEGSGYCSIENIARIVKIEARLNNMNYQDILLELEMQRKELKEIKEIFKKMQGLDKNNYRKNSEQKRKNESTLPKLKHKSEEALSTPQTAETTKSDTKKERKKNFWNCLNWCR